jgi:PAS domain S-box-containing protein
MPISIRVLIIEDTPPDADLMVMYLHRDGFSVDSIRVESENAFITELENPWDLILSDWSLPQFDGLRALRIMQERSLDIPFIIVSGGIGEEIAVATMRQGAADYLLKDRMDRLGQAVKNALEKKRLKDEYKKAADALSASEAELRALFSSMEDIVLVVDHKGFYKKIAPTKPNLLIKPAHELLGKNLREVFPKDVAQLFIEANQKVLETNQTQTIEYDLFLQGQQVWFETTISPLSDQEVIMVGRDVSERKQAEGQIRLQAAALASAANAIFITNRDGAIEWINPAFTLLTGYSFNDVIGKNPGYLKSGLQDQAFYQELWNTILAGQVWQGELINRRKDGSLYNEEQTITPLKNSAGQITQFIGIKQDVTPRKIAENTLKQHLQRQEKIAALGRELAATVSLDLIYQTAEKYIRSMLDCKSFQIMILDSRNNHLTTVYLSIGGTTVDVSHSPFKVFDPLDTSTGWGKSIASQTPEFYSRPGQRNSRPGQNLETDDLGINSILYFPLIAEKQVIGLLELQSERVEAYQPEISEWLNMITNQVALNLQNARLYSRMEQRIAELSALQTIDSAITAHLEPQKTYEILLTQINTQLRVDVVVLLLYDPMTRKLGFASELGYRNQDIQKLHLGLGEGLAGKVALNLEIVHVDLLSAENRSLLKKSSASEGFVEYYGVPLIANDRLIGVLEVINRSPILADDDWLRLLNILAGQSAIMIETIQLYANIQNANSELLKAYDATIEGWSQAMDLRDKETEGHTRRVSEITVDLARRMGFEQDQLIQVRRGALLHDIGKLGVPDVILRKPGPLSDAEWVIMRKHPEYAFRMLSSVEYIRPALDIPYCHHEKWDGTGYPRRLKEAEIPLSARIFSVVDVWDALTSDRPYRKAWTHDKTIEYIRDQSGIHFDPLVVAAFLDLLDSERSGENPQV